MLVLIKVVLRVVSIIFEGFIFLYLGLGLLSFGVTYEPLFIISGVFAILIGRTHVFGISWLTKFLPGSKPVPMNHQILLWLSGLRGAVAFALGVTFLELPQFSESAKESIFGTTVIVILVTVLLLGGFMKSFIKWLKIIPETDKRSVTSLHSMHFIDNQVDSPDEGIDQTITDEDLRQPIFGAAFRYDVK
jgi:sodium/hydrogen exchanger 8